ncbi:MAG: hypothetical protein MJ181_11395 [Treponema sp.]|nr:hypothetical protein [Treponema sp.]
MRNNLKDRKVVYTLILTILLIGLHTWQYIKSGHDPRALTNLIMCLLFIPSVLIWGMNCLSYFLLAYCFIYLPFEEFDNYTSLFLLCSAISLNKKLRFCFIPYVIETITVYMMTNKQISHLSVSLLYILFFWQVYVYIQDRHADQKPLDLKPEEERILQELAKGKMQKEIDFYSHVTVCKKLKDAKERNNCISTDELVTKYKSTNQLN